MRIYDFAVKGRNDLPRAQLEAANDDDFFQNVLPKWEKETRQRHVEDDVMCTISEVMRVPEPSMNGAPSKYPDAEVLHWVEERNR
jgi:hypothetical protein